LENKLTNKKSPTNKNWKKLPKDTPPEKLVDLAHAEIEKAKKKKAAKIAHTKTVKTTKKTQTVVLKNQVACDEKNCKYVGGSKGVVTRHWNSVHRKPHAQKRNTRKRNQDQGRPTVLTPTVIDKLVHAFEHGYTKTQAFRYSGISKDTYYGAMKSDEEFADKMRRAQDHLGLKARDVVSAAITANDVKTAKWWLERKAKDEYSLRREATGAGGGAVKVDSSNGTKPVSMEELHDAVLGNT
jgi:hypothetical protein